MNEFRIFRALGASFKACFVNFVPFTLVAAVLYSPAIYWVMTLDPEKPRTDSQLAWVVVFIPTLLVVGGSLLLAPLVTYRVIQYLNGTRVSIWTSIRYGLRGIVPAFVTAVIIGVIGFVPFLSIGSVIIACIWFVTTPAAVVEDLGMFWAFGRSSALTSGRRWRIFGMTLLLGSGLSAVEYGLLLTFAPMIESLAALGLIIIALVGIYCMIFGVLQAVTYVHLREDKDGMSSVELAGVFD